MRLGVEWHSTPNPIRPSILTNQPDPTSTIPTRLHPPDPHPSPDPTGLLCPCEREEAAPSASRHGAWPSAARGHRSGQRGAQAGWRAAAAMPRVQSLVASASRVDTERGERASAACGEQRGERPAAARGGKSDLGPSGGMCKVSGVHAASFHHQFQAPIPSILQYFAVLGEKLAARVVVVPRDSFGQMVCRLPGNSNSS
jgi:hypothetical protein